MSKILRRPMFRGGRVDSRGTGITANLGYQAGGRVGYKDGKLVTIQDILSRTNQNMTGGEILAYANRNNLNLGDNFKINEKSLFPVNESIGMGNFGISPSESASAMGTPIIDETEEFETEITASGDTKFKLDDKGDKIPIPKRDSSNVSVAEKIAIGKNIEQDTQGMDLVDLGLSEKAAGSSGTNILEERDKKIKGVTEIKPGSRLEDPDPLVIDEKALIKEQAELFKELLSEGKEDRVKKARIGDASDYLLKFFEGSQKEGATVGSSAADVAAFATSKDSRVDKAKASNEKIDQTATALAINDYVAGKRSKEDINKMIAGLRLKSEFAKGSLGSNIMDAAAKAGGTITTGSIETIVRGMNPGAEVVRITDQQVKDGYKVSSADNGKFLIEEGTKNVFEVVNGNKVRRY